MYGTGVCCSKAFNLATTIVIARTFTVLVCALHSTEYCDSGEVHKWNQFFFFHL